MDNVWNIFCKVSLIIVIFIVLNSMIGDLLFRTKYSFPHVSETTNYKINPYNDPVQNNLNDSKYIKAYGEKGLFALQPVAEYSISALVVAKNNNFWFRDIMRSEFDDICLIDFGLAWGDLVKDKKELYKHVKFRSKKTLGQARMLQYRWDGNAPWGSSYIMSHVSHTHMIPANSNVMGALLKIKKNDIVKLDGYLVDIYKDKGKLVAKTSLSREDTNASSRGYGACEDMYVKQVQIGNKIYR